MNFRSIRLDEDPKEEEIEEIIEESYNEQSFDVNNEFITTHQQIVPAVFARFHDEFSNTNQFLGGNETHPATVYLASLAPSGSRSMRMRLEQIAEMLTGHKTLYALPWEKLRYEHVVAIRTLLQERKLSPASINTTLYAIRGVTKAAWNMNLMDADQYTRIRNVRTSQVTRVPAGRSVVSNELSALLEACASDESPAGTRDAALLGVLYCGGLRRSEVVALNVEDYELSSGALKVTGKNNKERFVYIISNAAHALDDWLRWRGAGAFAQELESSAAIETEQGFVAGSTPVLKPRPLFCPIRKNGSVQTRRMTDQAIYLVLQKRAMQAGIVHCSPHDLRRSFVSDLIDRDVDIVTVQQLAGHADVTTTARYDRRGERAKQVAASVLHLPYKSDNSNPADE